MKFTTMIDNVAAMEWELTLSEAYFFAYLIDCSTWAEDFRYDGETYYFIDRRTVARELPLFSSKKDTVYRKYKDLEKKELIRHVKIDGRDYITFTEKSSTWNRARKNFRTSERSPNKDGKNSESPSEIFPTDHTIRKDQTINDQCKGRGRELRGEEKISEEAKKDLDEFGVMIGSKVLKKMARKFQSRCAEIEEGTVYFDPDKDVALLKKFLHWLRRKVEDARKASGDIPTVSDDELVEAWGHFLDAAPDRIMEKLSLPYLWSCRDGVIREGKKQSTRAGPDEEYMSKWDEYMKKKDQEFQKATK